MSIKRSHFDLDPDYEDVSDRQNKRQRVLEEGAKEATKYKIEKIIQQQFGQEIESKEAEIMNISEKLERSRTVLDRLRACVVASYFGNASQQKCSETQNSQQAPNIHPAVKKYLGKAPKSITQDEVLTFQPSSVNQEDCQETKVKITSHHGTEKIGTLSLESSSAKRLTESPVPNSNPVTLTTKTETDQSDTRAGRYKVKKRIIVGNVSKTIPADRRDENDQATHKWMVYVRGPKDSPRIDHFVKKVWFFLHPSYRPNDLVEISEHPFHLTRRGWGEFPVRVQLHFKDSRNKRLDIIHNLKLDRTYTSLQTLGAETVVDVELEKDITEVKKKTSKVSITAGEATITNSTIHAVKQEPEEGNHNNSNNNNVALVPSQVQVKIEPNGQAYIDETSAPKMIRNIKTEPIDHDYGFPPSHVKNTVSVHNIKKETVNTANFVIPGGSNNVRLVFSGIGGVGAPNILSSQVVPGLSSSLSSPVKIGITQHTSPKSQKKGQAVLGNTVNLQGIGSISNSGVLIPNQQGSKNNTVPVLLGNSPTKIVGNQSALQPGSILLSPVLPTNTPVSGNQLLLQSGSLLSPALPVTQAGSSTNQTNNSGLIFLKCTDNQGKTYLIPQQVCPSIPASKGTSIPAKGTNAIVNQTTLLLNNTQNQSSSNSKLSSPANAQIKPPVSSGVVNLNQLTAVGLQPKQSPMQLAGPLIFIKPEEVSKLGSQSKISVKSPPNSALDANSLQNNQSLRLLTPSKCQIGSGANSSETKHTVTQSNIRGQLKVTSQGLITVQNDNTSLNKNLVIKTEPVDEKAKTSLTAVKKNMNLQPASSIAKQPIIILPHNNKVPVSLQCKSTSLLTTAMKVSSVNSINNVVIVNAANDLTSKTVPAKGVTNTTVSSQIKTNSLPENANGQKTKTNMLLLQAKTPGSDKPNHLVIVPVSCANNTVTRPTVSIATVSSVNTSKSSVVSKSLTTVCSTTATSTLSSKDGNETTVSDTNKTMYIVVEGNSSKEMSSEGSDGQRSMTSLLNKAAVPVTSISSGSVSASKSSAVKILPAQSLLSSSSSSTSTPSSVFSCSNAIPVTISSTSGQRQTQVLVVNSNDEIKGTQKSWKADEKKIISLAPKKKRVMKEPEKAIRSLNISDYPDMLSLMRAAVLRHPLVAENTAKHLHPYCAASYESWLTWNVGKRRAAEWQRASSMRKFILSHLDGTDTFKGEPLWSVKQILTWCRLHAYSPHYLEKQLHPTGLNLQSESSLATDKNHKFRSLSGCSDVIQEVDLASQKTSGHLEYSSDDDIDIVATEPPKVKVKVEVKDTEADDSIEQLPVSDTAHFVQDVAKKIGIKFSPTEVEPGCCGAVSPDYIFSAMESFMSDILRETFALQVNMGRYPDALGVADVYRALSNLPITDFVTNKYFGVEDTGGVPTAYR